MILRQGDEIEITCGTRTVDGVVLLASPNGLSLIVGFDAMLGGHVGKMPVTMRDDDSGFSIIDGTEILVRKVP